MRRCAAPALIVSFSVLSVACGSDETSPGGGSGGADPGDADACSTTVSPGDDDTETVQTALIEAMSGDTICLSAGTYRFTGELSLAEHRDITLRGAGADRDDVVLDFSTQLTGDDGVTVTSDGFTIENMWIKNTSGNGIVVRADDSRFADLKVSWDGEPRTENGAYAVYPTNCNRTTIENIEVTGASDAGVYVGQCREAIVRNNKAHANVLGIEIENTIGADVYGNEVYDNAGGILVDLLPFKDHITESSGALIRDNDIHDNNRANFGEPGTVVASVPPGTGLMVLAADDTEIRDNTISDNDGVALIILSYDTVDLLLGETTDDPNTDRYPQRTFIHDNSFTNNGTVPGDVYGIFGHETLENVLWDGVLGPDTPDDASVQLCLGETEAQSFRNVTGMQSTDSTPHQCTLEPLPTLDF